MLNKKGKTRVYNQKEPSFEKLQTRLREGLDDRFSDDLIDAIVEAFYENETLRLMGSEYKVQAISPMNKEYAETIRDLNSHMILLSRWNTLSSSDLEKKVCKLLTDYEGVLDSIITDPIPYYLFNGIHEDKQGRPIKVEVIYNIYDLQSKYAIRVTTNSGDSKKFHGSWPSKYNFYYTALLVLLKSFSKMELQKKVSRGNTDSLGLNFADYATIYFYATIAKYYSLDNLEAERARFLKTHQIKSEPDNFKSSISSIQNLKRRRANGRLKRIQWFLEKYYEAAVEIAVKELLIK